MLCSLRRSLSCSRFGLGFIWPAFLLAFASCLCPEIKLFAAQHCKYPSSIDFAKIQLGMTKEEVLAILGEPDRIDPGPILYGPLIEDSGKERVENEQWEYGDIAEGLMRSPSHRAHVLWFDNTGKIVRKQDPYQGAISQDGLPTTPLLLAPPDRQVFDHYPRWLDFRWVPSAGVRPMEYDIEWAFTDKGSDENFGIWDESELNSWDTTQDEHFVVLFIGAQPGRWRVRARNSLGESEWSEWRFFRFTR